MLRDDYNSDGPTVAGWHGGNQKGAPPGAGAPVWYTTVRGAWRLVRFVWAAQKENIRNRNENSENVDVAMKNFRKKTCPLYMPSDLAVGRYRLPYIILNYKSRINTDDAHDACSKVTLRPEGKSTLVPETLGSDMHPYSSGPVGRVPQ